MKRILPLVLVSLAGCANYYASRPDLVERVEAWIAARDYQTALTTLSRVEPDHPDYARLQAKERALRSLVAGYERDILEDARQLVAREQWQEAYAAYERGVERFPASAALRAARESFLEQRERRIRELRLQAWVNEAQTLARNKRLYTEMIDTAPDSRVARGERHDAEDRARRAAGVLTEYAELSLVQGDYRAAGDYLDLAARLTADPGTTAVIRKLQEQRTVALRHSENRNRAAKARYAAQQAERREARLQELLSRYEEAVGAGRLAEAQQTLGEALEVKPEDPALAREQQRLKVRIAHQIETETERGRLMYSQGKVEQALAVWTPLLELAPEDEALQAHIERAERVLRKLERLSKQAPAIRVPPP